MGSSDTAPNRMAPVPRSAWASHSFSTSDGQGVPAVGTASSPTTQGTISSPKPQAFAAASSTRVPSRTISGPMPSPGMVRTTRESFGARPAAGPLTTPGS